MTFALCAVAAIHAAESETPAAVKAEVLKAEAAFNEAKLHNDFGALERIVADDYIGVNQWGARRDKQTMIDLFRNYQTTALVASRVKVHGVGDTIIVEGIMNESNREKYLFVRTYVKRNGHWLLLASAHSYLLQPGDVNPRDPESIDQ
jgi:hypothetical protein